MKVGNTKKNIFILLGSVHAQDWNYIRMKEADVSKQCNEERMALYVVEIEVP